MTYPFRILIPMMASALACVLATSVYGQIPLASIPTNLPRLSDVDRQELEVERKELSDARGRIGDLMKAHSAQRVPAETPAVEQLRFEGVQLRAMMSKHIEASREFNAKVASLVAKQSRKGTAFVVGIETRGTFSIELADGRKLAGHELTSARIDIGTRITTGPDGRVRIVLPDETVFIIGKNSDVLIDDFVYESDPSLRKVSADLAKGLLRGSPFVGQQNGSAKR